jgi:hypothetical protein
MADPKPTIVIMVKTTSPPTIDHLDYDGFGEIASTEQLSHADHHDFVCRESNAADLTYRRGHCRCAATRPPRRLAQRGGGYCASRRALGTYCQILRSSELGIRRRAEPRQGTNESCSRR